MVKRRVHFRARVGNETATVEGYVVAVRGVNEACEAQVAVNGKAVGAKGELATVKVPVMALIPAEGTTLAPQLPLTAGQEALDAAQVASDSEWGSATELTTHSQPVSIGGAMGSNDFPVVAPGGKPKTEVEELIELNKALMMHLQAATMVSPPRRRRR